MLVRTARHLGTSALRAIAPRLLWKLRLSTWYSYWNDAERRLLPQLCDPRKTSVDIGACHGVYTMAMLCYSKECVAFEARPDQAATIQELFRREKAPVTVHAAALSDRAGTASLRVSRADLGLSTITPEHSLPGDVEIISVPMHRLDDYGLHRVGCLKIDVEGHEEAVLEGARETLRTSRPNVIVELQEDRNPGRIAAVQKRLEALELHGFFLYQQELHPIEDFDPGLHQNRARIPYVVNFVFVQPPVAAKLRAQYRL